MSFEAFRADKRTTYAVVRCLEIISEASRRLPPELKARYPQLQWSNMAGAGSVYRHQYHEVEDGVLWQTIHESLDPLRIVVEQELKRLDKE